MRLPLALVLLLAGCAEFNPVPADAFGNGSAPPTPVGCAFSEQCPAGQVCAGERCAGLSTVGTSCVSDCAETGAKCDNSVCCANRDGACCTSDSDCPRGLACDVASAQCAFLCDETTNNGCVPGTVCQGSSCVPPLANGSACSSATQCESGFCVDGTCCDTACDSLCQSCRSGACSALDAGFDLEPTQLCFEDAGCSGGTDCQCVDGACLALCAPGTCAPEFGCLDGVCVPRSSNGEPCDGIDTCEAGLFCNSMTCGLKPNGTSCAGANECASTYCVDGVCCESACDAPCFQCGTGSCDPLSVGTDAGCSEDGAGCMGGSCSCQLGLCVEASCNENDDCPGATCISGSCEAPSSAGGLCDDNDDCEPDLSCVHPGVCATPSPLNGPCDDETDCADTVNVDCGSSNTCECDDEFADCTAAPGCETPTGSDLSNCGTCGLQCGDGSLCIDALCLCPAGNQCLAPGTCGPLEGANLEPWCGTACNDDEDCDPNESCVTRLCRPRGNEGDGCLLPADCLPGLVCVPTMGPNAFVCARLRAPYSSCEEPSDCPLRHVCEAERCLPMNGELCDQDLGCQPGTECQFIDFNFRCFCPFGSADCGNGCVPSTQCD